MSSLLSVRNLSLSLAGSIDVLSDISFDIKKNSTVLLSGKNGSGKSMLLRTLKGLIPFQKGSVFLDGEDVTRKNSYRNAHIALVFQDTETQIVGQSVHKDLLFGLQNTGIGKSESNKRIEQVASLLDITHLLDRRPMQLSGGEKRRVAIGGVLVMNPQLIFLDEPFANLDYPGIRQVLMSILALQKSGTTVIIATHEVEKVAYHCDTMMIMEKGRIETTGPAKTVLENAADYDIKIPSHRGEPLDFEELTYLS